MTDTNFRVELKKYEKFESIISIICKKFKNTITYFDVISLLENFAPNEHEMALDILQNISYFDDIDIITAFNNGFMEIVKNISQQSEVIIMSIGDYGKSGSAMMYFLSKTDAFINKTRIRNIQGQVLSHNFRIINEPKDLKSQIANINNNNVVIIMVDDFFGTGNSVIEFYFGLKNGIRDNTLIDFDIEFRTHLQQYPSVKFLAVSSMNKAVEKIEQKIPSSQVVCNYVFFKAFEPNRSPFGYRKKMMPVRKLCFSYGESLNKTGALGYQNSQSLVVFSYGTPNNTLPIIWADKKGWVPIFPRFYKHKAARAKEFRSETAYHLSIAKSLGVKNIDKFLSGQRDLGWKKFHFITKTDFLLFALIKLKRTIGVKLSFAKY
nr:hypothetical protein P5664_19100 [Bacillus subtilis]